MFVAVRRYTYENTTLEEAKRELEGDFLPRASQIPGFVAYYAIDCGGNKLTTVSVFETREGEEASTQIAAGFIAEKFAGKITRTTLDEGKTIVEQAAARV